MKKIIFSLGCIFLLLPTKIFSQQNDIKGVYTMLRQAHVEGGKDSLLKREQIKFYTGKYMLHASPKHNDSVGEFGIGTYVYNGNTLTEYVFYSSVAGDFKDTFQLHIIPTNNGFTQEIEFELSSNRVFTLTEDYQRVGTPANTFLDGVWELEKGMVISSTKDTVVENRVQYKVYLNGYFAWVTDYGAVAAGSPKTSFGYGTFTLNGKNLKEDNINSTYYSLLVGHSTNITVDRMGNNRYKQTITSDSGEKYVEVYKKLE